MLRAPAVQATNAARNACLAERAPAMARIGIGANQVSHHIGCRPVPQKKAIAATATAITVRLRLESIKKPFQGTTDQGSEFVTPQAKTAAQVERDVTVNVRVDRERDFPDVVAL